MTHEEKRKLAALGKMALGAGQITSGCLTAFGKGVLGALLKNHGLSQLGMQLGRYSFQQGTKRFEEGLAEFKR